MSSFVSVPFVDTCMYLLRQVISIFFVLSVHTINRTQTVTLQNDDLTWRGCSKLRLRKLIWSELFFVEVDSVRVILNFFRLRLITLSSSFRLQSH